MRYHNETKIVEAATIISNRKNPVELVTALNHSEAKTLFLEKAAPSTLAKTSFPASANPVFVYDTDLLEKSAKDFDKIATARATLLEYCEAENAGDSVVLKLAQRRAEDALLTSQIAQGIIKGDDELTKLACCDKYDTPSPKDSVEAYNAANGLATKSTTGGSTFSDEEKAELSSIEIDAKGLEQLFRRVMFYLGIDPWKIIITPKCTAIDVRDFNAIGVPTVFIPESRKVNGLKAVELACHEICCHLYGSDNGQKFFRTILANTPLSPLIASLAKSDNETLYEGVAKISDVAVSGSKSEPSPLATVAIDLASRGVSFNEVAEVIYEYKLRSGVKSETALSSAWGVVYRVFRGSTDTAKNKGCYAFPKDCAYFLGYKKAHELESEAIYSLYASMEAREIASLAGNFPNFAEIAQPQERTKLIKQVASFVS